MITVLNEQSDNRVTKYVTGEILRISVYRLHDRPRSQVDHMGVSLVGPVGFFLFSCMTSDGSRTRCCVNRTARITAAYRRASTWSLHRVPQPHGGRAAFLTIAPDARSDYHNRSITGAPCEQGVSPGMKTLIRSAR